MTYTQQFYISLLIGISTMVFLAFCYMTDSKGVKDETIAEGLTDPIITCACGLEYKEQGYVYGCTYCPTCGRMNWVEKKEIEQTV